MQELRGILTDIESLVLLSKINGKVLWELNEDGMILSVPNNFCDHAFVRKLIDKGYVVNLSMYDSFGSNILASIPDKLLYKHFWTVNGPTTAFIKQRSSDSVPGGRPDLSYLRDEMDQGIPMNPDQLKIFETDTNMIDRKKFSDKLLSRFGTGGANDNKGCKCEEE